MAKVKMSSLAVDRKTWVRKRMSLDHVECLVRDIINGDKLPPLLVDKKTHIIVGGNHRFEGWKRFYGDTWPDKEVEVEWVNLPSFEDDPQAWWKVALDDNQHLSERLRWQDRQTTAINLIKTLDDPLSAEGQEFARLIKHTPETWKAFCENYIGNVTNREGEGKMELPRLKQPPSKSKSITEPTLPSDVKNVSINSSVMHHAVALTRILESVGPDDLSQRSHARLSELSGVISMVSKAKTG